MVRLNRCVGLVALGVIVAGAAAGCGSDEPKGASFASIMTAIESPTGTVSATTAADIGDEFEKMAQADFAGGMRRDAQVAQAGTQTQSCPAGGDFTVTASGGESNGSATISYDDCCYVAGCCFDGNGTLHYASGGGEEYTFCAAYDMQYSCDGENASLDYQGCFSPTGWVYAVEVDGETFAVSGNYSDGSGTLTIEGENGSWTCTYSAGSGHCEGEGEEFDF